MHLIGKTFGKYRIMDQIGQEDMVVVYKAYQPELDRFVTFKVLHSYYAKSEGFQERFIEEAKTIAKMSHPNILPIYDTGVEKDVCYFVMKYVQGNTLRDVLGQFPLRRFPLRRAHQLITHISGALDYAHQRGIIHRDVKPANILLEGESAYLTDFGIAKMVEGTVDLASTGQLLGTPHYMSPEHVGGDKLGHRTDIYSLGVVLFEMLTGRVPYAGETPYAILLKLTYDPLPLPRSLRPDLPEDVERAILKALAKDPEHRYDRAGELADALSHAVASSPIPVVPIRDLGEAGNSRPQYSETDARSCKRPPSKKTLLGLRKKALWTAGALIAVAVVAGGFFYTNSPTSYMMKKVQKPIERQTGFRNSFKAPIPLESTPFRGTLPTNTVTEDKQLAEDKQIAEEQLKPKSASVEAGPSPSTAEVYEGGAPKGKTPLISEVPVSEPTVRMALEAFQNLEDTAESKEARDYHQTLAPAPEEHKEQTSGGAGPQDDLQSLYLAATRHFEQKSYKDAFRDFTSAAQRGDPKSQTELGYMYHLGLGVTRNDVESAQWYRKAAEQGLAAAQNNLGVMTLKGEGVPKSDQQAFAWFEKAALGGDLNGQFHLATMYLKGIGVARDQAKAFKWYRKAAEQGHEQAKEAIKRIARERR